MSELHPIKTVVLPFIKKTLRKSFLGQHDQGGLKHMLIEYVVQCGTTILYPLVVCPFVPEKPILVKQSHEKDFIWCNLF